MTITNAPALKRPPSFGTDANGTPIATITLANGGSATLDLHDWERLLLRGVSANWTLNTAVAGFAYVRAKLPGQRTVMVAREIIGARPGEIVRYRNGDRTDLRRANLTISTGGRAKAHVSLSATNV